MSYRMSHEAFTAVGRHLRGMMRGFRYAARTGSPSTIDGLAQQVAMSWLSLEDVDICDELEVRSALRNMDVLRRMAFRYPMVWAAVVDLLQSDTGNIVTPECHDDTMRQIYDLTLT